MDWGGDAGGPRENTRMYWENMQTEHNTKKTHPGFESRLSLCEAKTLTAVSPCSPQLDNKNPNGTMYENYDILIP